MPKLVLMPPLDRRRQEWLPRLREALPCYVVALPESDDEAREEMRDADGAYGVVPLEALKTANKRLNSLPVNSRIWLYST